MARRLLAWLAVVVIMAPLLGGARAPSVSAQTPPPVSGPPTVNGLFYGDDDYLRYTLYNTSYTGSKLYIYTDQQAGQPTYLYAALVVSRVVNDNVFDAKGKTAYEKSAGWQPDHPFGVLVGSDMAEFILECNGTTYDWEMDLLELNTTTGQYYSAPNVGIGNAPTSMISASSTAWNVNNYRAKWGTTSNPSAPWDMYVQGTAAANWHSPYTGTLGAAWFPQPTYGYPAGLDPIGWSSYFEWEWPLVYEFRVNMCATCAGGPIDVLVGMSHNSPSKDGDENDDFPPDGGVLKDWGDLPASYGTLLANNGPRHEIVCCDHGIYLGTRIDSEHDGQPSIIAAGDDYSTSDDEDGVTLVNRPGWREVTNGGTISVTFTNGASSGLTSGWLAVWFDWNNNGTFEASEAAVYQSVSLPTGVSTQQFSFNIPWQGLNHDLYYRARLFTSEPTALGGTSAFLGLATNGEVEDYWDSMPTAVTLRSFTARGLDNAVRLRWETASESDTLGYNLYRARWPKGPRTKLNAEAIASLVAPGSGEGALYKWTDAPLKDGVKYYYWLETLGLDGSATLTGPIGARTK